MSSNEYKHAKSQIHEEMARKKAEEMGVRHDELRTRVVDGKTVWVTKSDLNVELEKQRKIAQTNKIIRSVRDGEKSLFGLITKEIQNARSLCSLLVELQVFHAMQKRDTDISVSTIETRAIDCAKQISELEAKIDKQKTNNSVVGQAADVMKVIQNAKQAGDRETVAKLMQEHRPVLEAYQKQVSALEPTIQACRTYRVDLQKLYIKIGEKVWELRERVHQLWRGWIQDTSPYIEEVSKLTFEKDLAWISFSRDKLTTELRSVQRTLPAGDEMTQEMLARWDSGIVQVQGLLVQQQQFMKELSALVDIYTGKKMPAMDSSKRMAFAQKQKR